MTKNETARLVKSAQEGDKGAFEKLYEEYRGRLLAFAQKNVGSPVAAEDVVSETFLAAFREIGGLGSAEAFGSWVYSIAYNKCRDHLEGESRSVHFDTDAELAEAVDKGLNEPLMLPDDYAENADTRRRLGELIDKMPREMRLAVILFYYNELSVAEVAKTLGTNVNNVLQKLCKARRYIRKRADKLTGSDVELIAVPLGAVLNSALEPSYVKAVTGVARVKSMGIGAKIAVAGAITTVAVAIPIGISKLGEGGGYRGEDSQIHREINFSELEAEGFAFAKPEEACKVDFAGLEHLTAAEDIMLMSDMPESVIEFDYTGTDTSTYEHRDELGRFYIGEEYLSSGWSIKSEITLNNGSTVRDAVYETAGFGGYLGVSDGSFFFFHEDRSKLSEYTAFDKGDVPIADGDTRYELADGTSLTYAEAVRIADELIKGYDEALGLGRSSAGEVTYNEEKKALKVSYLPKINGVGLSMIRNVIELDDTEWDGLSVHTSNVFPKKAVYLYGSGYGYKAVSAQSEGLDITETGRYDRVMTLRSALEYFDKTVSDNLHFEVRSAGLKYLLGAVEKQQDNGDISLEELHGFPVWEVILYSETADREYAYLINALSGENSLVKIDRRNDPVVVT